MTDAQSGTLVLQDNAGEYYLLPQAMLERGRVPAEHRADVERLVSEREGDDVAGHIIRAAGVLTMPTVVAALRQLADDAKLIDWIGEQLYSGGKA
jgi:hypothetical protein